MTILEIVFIVAFVIFGVWSIGLVRRFEELKRIKRAIDKLDLERHTQVIYTLLDYLGLEIEGGHVEQRDGKLKEFSSKIDQGPGNFAENKKNTDRLEEAYNDLLTRLEALEALLSKLNK